eukprot:TRINITY_DN9083_c0_g2_i1.p1 TRINITY_DN9083_c0_g2~~TRINITY_DN9083_c0_g2_i1.p1  ORF type:complete len:312 (-),score=103.15 TRINITY_DN9083_c0_g2_i1:250-1185(-)
MDGFNSDEAGSEGYSSEETEEVPRPGQDLEARRQRNLENAGMMSQKLLEITVKGPGGGALPWAETLQVTAAEPLLIPDVHDDLQRESAFYRQALSCVPLAWRLCDEAGVKHRRPDDYFAEMLKSDEHMDKIKNKLLFEKKRIETIEEKKKLREMKKYGKQVQVQQQQERQKRKKLELDRISKLRKVREKGNAVGGDEFPVELDDEAPAPERVTPASLAAAHKNKQQLAGSSQLPHKSRKRKHKDEKYGHGGKKRFSKSNDAASFESMKGFSIQRNNRPDRPKSPHTRMPGKGSKPKAKAARPGKSKRRKQA